MFFYFFASICRLNPNCYCTFFFKKFSNDPSLQPMSSTFLLLTPLNIFDESLTKLFIPSRTSLVKPAL